MILYAGDDSRVFVGNTTASFIPKVSKYLNKCVGEEAYNASQNVIIKANNILKSKVASHDLVTIENKNMSKSLEEKSSEELSATEKDDLKARANHLQEFLNHQVLF